jgi:hypothetical protein
MKKLALTLTCLLGMACSDVTAPPTQMPDLSNGNNQGRGPTVCRSTLPPGTYRSVLVPGGATCVIENSIILEDVRALALSRLTLFNTDVGGNVTASRADAVNISAVPLGAGSVAGLVHIEHADSPMDGPSTVFINNMELHGGVLIEQNNATEIIFVNNTAFAGDVVIAGNDVAFSLTVTANRFVEGLVVVGNTGPAMKSVQNNFGAGTVTCLENEQPFVGGPNFTLGGSSGQCF